MEDAELRTVVDAWIAATEAERGTPEEQSNWWAISEVINWQLEGEAELLWRLVLAAYRRELSDKVLASLAAGPLEDLLSDFGPAYIDRVEELARKDPRFNWLLGGVWRLSMTDEVWARVQAARLKVW
ncbi:MAG TPA: hypothetical protein VEY11_06970 [Pyrinomonadaceae bacterium]|nr:hypothetical protein [Pyrinomonadaceae bacterium]